VTIKDIAEGFDRALRLQVGLDNNEPFDVVVHSTGMLVIRAWLARYAQRRGRLKHLIALAPATFGAPLAHKGRSWLGAMLKGNRDFGPDFLEAGDQVLDGLELASRFTWDLAHQDILAEPPFYGADADTPYVFIFCGTVGYSGIRGLVNEPGTDGTVRWAGCALSSRKVILDLTREPDLAPGQERIRFEPWRNAAITLTPIEALNHGTIMSQPSKPLINLVDRALQVSDVRGLDAWQASAAEQTQATRDSMEQWQQFVFRAVDERGDPITDYNIQLFGGAPGALRPLEAFDLDVHAYRADPSLRCFHVRHNDFAGTPLESLELHLLVSSGTALIGYYGSIGGQPDALPDGADPRGWWEGRFNLSDLLAHADGRFFYPFTTTLVEMRLNREPLPLDPTKPTQVLGWL